MNTRLDIFEKLLEKMKFREPVPPGVQGALVSYKVKALAAVLKHYGEYSIFYGIALRAYIHLQKLGLKISVAQSKIIALLLAASIAGTTAAGGYLLIRGMVMDSRSTGKEGFSRERNAIKGEESLPEDESIPGKRKKTGKEMDKSSLPDRKDRYINEKQEKSETGDSDTIDSRGVKDEIKTRQKRCGYRLGVNTFSSEAVDPREKESITSLVTGELIRLKGKGKIVQLGKSRKNVSLMLVGSIERLGESTFISVKVVDVKTTKIIFTVSERVSGEEDTSNACRRLAEKIAGGVE